MWNKLLLLTLFTFGLSSCNKPINVAGFEDILNKAGNNRVQIEKVIQHFSSNSRDSLKLKASVFLLKNMRGLYFYEGEQLDQYEPIIKLAKENPSDQGDIVMAFEQLYDRFDYINLKKQYDLEHVKAEEVIENVNLAFKVWQNQPWGKDVSFQQFCEYILPFRISNAAPERNRKQLYDKFNPLLDSVRKVNGDAVLACKVLNDALIKEGWLGSDYIAFLPHFKTSQLLKHKIGTCRDMTDAAIYIMRSVGIPVAVDAVHQWPYKKNSHAWNVLIGKNGESMVFMGMEQSPGTTNKPGTKKGKVYRKMYSLNRDLLQLQKDQKENVPPPFNNSRLKDVTAEYTKTYDLATRLEFSNTSQSYVYLSVFNNRDWVPITWAKTAKRTAIFKKMEPGIVYMPVYFNKSSGVTPAGFPTILDHSGKATTLKPNERRHSKMKLYNIYPLIPDQFRVTKLWGGKFQGANNTNFNRPTDLYNITDPMPFWNKVRFSKPYKFRYFRFVPAHGYATDVSELSLYFKGVRLEGAPTGYNGSSYDDKSLTNIVDNKFASRFITKYSVNTWVGIDLGKEQSFDEIQYAAGINEKKFTEVSSSNEYELLYWSGQEGWISVGRKVALSGQVDFENVPSGALYILRNLTRDSDERIFTYENNKQIWW